MVVDEFPFESKLFIRKDLSTSRFLLSPAFPFCWASPRIEQDWTERINGVAFIIQERGEDEVGDAMTNTPRQQPAKR